MIIISSHLCSPCGYWDCSSCADKKFQKLKNLCIHIILKWRKSINLLVLPKKQIYKLTFSAFKEKINNQFVNLVDTLNLRLVLTWCCNEVWELNLNKYHPSQRSQRVFNHRSDRDGQPIHFTFNIYFNSQHSIEQWKLVCMYYLTYDVVAF